MAFAILLAAWMLGEMITTSAASNQSLPNQHLSSVSSNDNLDACQPKRLHLSQAANVDQNKRVGMILSFSLDYPRCHMAQPVRFFCELSW